MLRVFQVMALGLATAAVAQGHALFLVPGTDDTKVLVVFGDQLAPDEGTKDATWKRLEGLTLSARDASGKVTQVKHTKEKGHLLAAVPAGTKVVFGEVEYGLHAKGDATPMLIKYYPKTVLGEVPTDGGKLDDTVEVEIVPKVAAGKVRFQVLSRGKPVAGAAVSVMVPGKKEEAQEKTDAHGWTAELTGTGKYGATYRQVEKKGGERDGKKFDGVSHTATLVVDVK